MSTLSIFAFIDGLGGGEVLMIAFVALILFGGKNLPSLARTMGRTMREFKKASSEVEREIRKAIDEAPDNDAPARPLATVSQSQSLPTQPLTAQQMGLVDPAYEGANLAAPQSSLPAVSADSSAAMAAASGGLKALAPAAPTAFTPQVGAAEATAGHKSVESGTA